MNEYLFGKDKLKSSSVIALGGFDALHLGHRFLINKGKILAEKLKAPLSVFTLDGDLSFVNARKKGLVYTYEERLEIFSELAVNGVIRALFDKNFANISAEEFLNRLKNDFSPVGIICGGDYSFGKNAEGSADMLKDFCKEHGIIFEKSEFLSDGGEKISASTVKSALLSGDVKLAEKLSGGRYFIKSEVILGRTDGRKLGFPTANMLLPSGKLALKTGVYATCAKINDESYIGITNFGSAPTFGVQKLVVETHFLDFSGDLYGKKIKLEFFDYLRENKKFESLSELKAQLTRDEAAARKIFNKD